MVKAYLKYQYTDSVGLFKQSTSNLIWTQNLLIIAANEYLLLYNLKTKQILNKFTKPNTNSPITCLHKIGSQVLAGYQDGEILIFDIDSDHDTSIVAQMNEHTASINVLAVSDDQYYMFSGAKDTTIIVWDRLQHKMLFKLQGHKNQVTFVKQIGQYLVSGSLDGCVRFWDLSLNQCVSILALPNTEINSVLTFEIHSYQLLVCFQQNELKFMTVQFYKDTNGYDQYYREIGSMKRQSYSKIVDSHFRNGLIYLLTSDNTIEIYMIMSQQQVDKKLKRKRQRKEQQINQQEYIRDVQNNIQYLNTIHLTQKVLQMVFGAGQQLILNYPQQLIKYSLKYEQDQKQYILQDEENISTVQHLNQIQRLRISSDDNSCVAISKEVMTIWRIDSDQLRWKTKVELQFSGIDCVFLPKDRFIVIGDIKGNMMMYDTNSDELIFNQKMHEQRVSSIDCHKQPDGYNGIVIMSGSSDNHVHFYQLSLQDQQLALNRTKKIDMAESVLCVKYFPNGKYYAVSLLDNTIRLYYSDSDKLYLSLYGHKLPVHCLDISSDNSLIATGGNDKNIKIWGSDFGDLKKSIFAHQQAICDMVFTKDTHYLMSCSKDGLVKYWDLDSYQQIQEYEQHIEAVNCIALTKLADLMLTAGMDRVIRVYRQTDQQVFTQELVQSKNEKLLVDNYLKDKLQKQDHDQADSKLKFDTIKYGEQIMEAIDLIDKIARDNEDGKDDIEHRANLYVLGNRSPAQYLLDVLKDIKYNELEDSLKFVHMVYIVRLIEYVSLFVNQKQEIELCTRIVSYVLDKDKNYVLQNKHLLELMGGVQKQLKELLTVQQQKVKFNLSGLKLLQNQMHFQKEAGKIFKQDEEFTFI